MGRKKYPIVTLCGSTRFKKEFLAVQEELTLRGYIVISAGLFDSLEDEDVWENKDEGKKIYFDLMHKEKIHMADEIYVVNTDGDIGESTWSDICYAHMLKKPIRFMNYVDERAIDVMVKKHIHIAEELAWQQMDFILHKNGYYNIENYTYFTHKRKEIVDPWINLETHYNGTLWPGHNNPAQAVDPFEYYGRDKMALFIEEIIMRSEGTEV